jgi:nucleoside-diphosphate-sugar epimerase
MKVLIIGGTRFLGLAIVRELIQHNHTVTVVHRGKTDNGVPRGVTRVHMDVRNREAFEAFLTENKFDAVIDTILTADDLNWLLPVFHFTSGQTIHCGSTGVYAPVIHGPSREDDPTPCPEALGGFREKLEQDLALLEYFEKTGYRVCTLRISNVIGAGDVPLDIWGARNPAYFQRMIDGEPIWVPNDGRALVQPAHVEDLARGFRLVLEADDRVAGQIYNLSSERAVTLMQYARLAAKTLNSRSEISVVPMEAILATGKANESGLRFICEHMCVDISKAAADLGYRPEIDVRQGLRESLEWMVRQGLIEWR